MTLNGLKNATGVRFVVFDRGKLSSDDFLQETLFDKSNIFHTNIYRQFFNSQGIRVNSTREDAVTFQFDVKIFLAIKCLFSSNRISFKIY